MPQGMQASHSGDNAAVITPAMVPRLCFISPFPVPPEHSGIIVYGDLL